MGTVIRPVYNRTAAEFSSGRCVVRRVGKAGERKRGGKAGARALDHEKQDVNKRAGARANGRKSTRGEENPSLVETDADADATSG